jgi:hypothetical protein
MKEDAKSEKSGAIPACSWCGRRLRPEECESGRVCEQCVRLLKGSGLPDEKIFAPPKQKTAFH